jgi:hypothetical protein
VAGRGGDTNGQENVTHQGTTSRWKLAREPRSLELKGSSARSTPGDHRSMAARSTFCFDSTGFELRASHSLGKCSTT